MARGGEKPEEDTEEVGLDDKNIGTGGTNHAGAGNLIQGGDTGSFSILVRDVGDNPPHGAGNWVVLTQGRYMDHWEVAPAVSVRKLVVPTFGYCDAGGRF